MFEGQHYVRAMLKEAIPHFAELSSSEKLLLLEELVASEAFVPKFAARDRSILSSVGWLRPIGGVDITVNCPEVLAPAGRPSKTPHSTSTPSNARTR